MHEPSLERTFSQVLDAGYDIARNHFRPLFTLALVGSAPTLLFLAAGTNQDGAEPSALEASLLIVGLLLSIGFLFYLHGALTHAVCRVALGEGIDVTRSLNVARAALPRMVWSVFDGKLMELIANFCSIYCCVCQIILYK